MADLPVSYEKAMIPGALICRQILAQWEKVKEIRHERSNMIMTANGTWPSTHMTLIERMAVAEDAEAWGYFYKVYSPLIFRFCQRQHLQRADAEDVCQKIIESMRRSLPKYAAAKGRFRYWFSRVIQRQLAKHQKRKARMPRELGGDAVDTIPAATHDPDFEEEVRKYIVGRAVEEIRAKIAPDEWTILSEVVIKGRKPRDLAGEMGWSAPSISKAKYRLIKLLKEKVHFLDNGDPSLWKTPVEVHTDGNE
jgi:RNA polymerase sigma-70 factor, ECF subfamily